MFTTLFEGAMRAGFFEVGQDRQLLLDVLVSNWRVHALYRRLGFIDMPRINARSRKLPAALESMQMCCAALNLVYHPLPTTGGEDDGVLIRGPREPK